MRFVKLLATAALGVGVVSAAVLVLVLIMRGRVGENAVADLPPPELSTSAATGPAVVLLRANATLRYFATLPGSAPDAYERRVDDWRRRLEAAGARVTTVDEAALATLAIAPGTVLVAPSAAALDEDTVTRILTTVEHGTGLVATWAFALYDGDGAWRGYGPLERLAGLRPLGDAETVAAPRFVALHGQTSLTVGLPAGARLEVQPYDRPLPLTTDAAVADYVDWAMLALGAPEAPRYQTAVARAACGSGRVVWMNFEPSALVGGGAGPDRLTRLVGNALAWTARVPLADLATWPGGAQAAASIGLDAEHEFTEGEAVARRLASSEVPFTSFVLTELASEHPDVVRALAATSEIASHTHDHRALSEQSEDEQREQLVRSRAVLADMTGREIVGLRPPEEQTNAATLSALANTGYRWVVGWREKDRAEPWIMQANGKAVVVLPRIPHDDFEYAVRRAEEDPATAWTSMRADLQHVRRLGGFYFFDFHTQFWGAPAIRQGVAHLTGLRNLPGVWLATVGDVAAWWRTRSRAAVRVDTGADGALVVEVAAGVAAASLDVVVYPPRDPASYASEPLRGGAPAEVVADQRAGLIRLEYRDLGAGERRQTRLVPSGPATRS